MPILPSNPWWAEDPTERFWLESTSRADIGANLKAPYEDESGRETWRYTLALSAAPGDIVLHYSKTSGAIVGFSELTGEQEDRPIVWGARGTSARHRGITPHERPGYVLGLRQYTELRMPVTLQRIGSNNAEILALLASLKTIYHRTLYYPFETGTRPGRPLQGYVFKLPRGFVEMFAELHPALELGAANAVEQPDGWQPGGGCGSTAGANDGVQEGRSLQRLHWVRERSRALVDAKKRSVIAEFGCLACEVCGFDFESKYGELGKDFAECHHEIPISEIQPGHITTPSELAIVCANCHRMLHHLPVHDMSLDAVRQRLAEAASTG